MANLYWEKFNCFKVIIGNKLILTQNLHKYQFSWLRKRDAWLVEENSITSNIVYEGLNEASAKCRYICIYIVLMY